MKTLTIAIQQFSAWRKRKGRGGGVKIPDNLWEAAAAAARDLDPISVARALGVSSHELRRRMDPRSATFQPPSESDVVVFPAAEVVAVGNAEPKFLAEILLGSSVHIRVPAGTPREDLKALLGVLLEVV
jgi:hypothetical protein